MLLGNTVSAFNPLQYITEQFCWFSKCLLSFLCFHSFPYHLYIPKWINSWHVSNNLLTTHRGFALPHFRTHLSGDWANRRKKQLRSFSDKCLFRHPVATTKCPKWPRPTIWAFRIKHFFFLYLYLIIFNQFRFWLDLFTFNWLSSISTFLQSRHMNNSVLVAIGFPFLRVPVAQVLFFRQRQ